MAKRLVCRPGWGVAETSSRISDGDGSPGFSAAAFAQTGKPWAFQPPGFDAPGGLRDTKVRSCMRQPTRSARIFISYRSADGVDKATALACDPAALSSCRGLPRQRTTCAAVPPGAPKSPAPSMPARPLAAPHAAAAGGRGRPGWPAYRHPADPVRRELESAPDAGAQVILTATASTIPRQPAPAAALRPHRRLHLAPPACLRLGERRRPPGRRPGGPGDFPAAATTPPPPRPIATAGLVGRPPGRHRRHRRPALASGPARRPRQRRRHLARPTLAGKPSSQWLPRRRVS